MRTLLAGLLLLLASGGYAQDLSAAKPALFSDSNSPSFLPVEEAYQLDAHVNADHSLNLYWQIAEGYYLYRHRFAFALDNDGTANPLKVELPAGLEREDEFFGQVTVYYHQADVLLRPDTVTGRATLTVTSQGCADAGLCYPPRKQYFAVDFDAGTITGNAAPGRSAAASPATSPEAGELLFMLLLAFVGGAILNLMPCVFPVLSLKVLGFANNSTHDRHRHSWVYGAGVVISFVLVAAVLIGLQQAGHAIGWGFQLQSPGFVIALAYLFVAMGLSLSGLVDFGGNIMNTGNELASREGLAGSFFTGVLAVVVASPCTAPFMGTALGFAITQPPHVGLLVFAALGAGMAAPLILLGYSGVARRLMPRPGAWMDTLKQLLAFPLYGTAIWLLWVAGRQTGVDSMAVALTGALVLTLGLWLWRHRDWRKILALTFIIAAISLGMWRGLDAAPDRNRQLSDGRVAWSATRLAQLRAAGRPVFVDVTADWCITCIANERAVLLTDEMKTAFADNNVVYMVADWTNYNPDIAAMLKRFGRTGIPLYLMYPANPALPPVILSQILTKNDVLQALQSAATKKVDLVDNFVDDGKI